jgi:hypothetical protein
MESDTTVVCIGITCRAQVKRSQAVPASKVPGNRKRGWYCPRCADYWTDLLGGPRGV